MVCLSVHFLHLPVSSVDTTWSVYLFISYIYLFLQSLLHGLSICSSPTSTCFFSRYYMVCLSVHFLHLPVSSVATTWSVYLFISYIYLFLQLLLYGPSVHFLLLPRHLGWTKERVFHNYRLHRSKFRLFRGKVCPMLSCKFILSFVLLFLSIVLVLLFSYFHIMVII